MRRGQDDQEARGEGQRQERRSQEARQPHHHVCQGEGLIHHALVVSSQARAQDAHTHTSQKLLHGASRLGKGLEEKAGGGRGERETFINALNSYVWS